MNAFSLGIIFGVSITISFGPGFIALFQTSLIRGLNAGFIFATGILLSDLTLVAVSYFGLSELIPKEHFRLMGIISGLILIVMGGVSVLRTTVHSLDSDRTTGRDGNLVVIFAKGYLLNIANPFSLIFWIGIVGYAARNWGLHSQSIFLFLAGVFTTAYISDLVKCFLSRLLKKVLTVKTIQWISRTMGIVFIGIGCFIIFKIR